MPYLHDELDRKLIAELRNDARASISHLASCLKVSRGTVQHRLDRLLSTGAILGFTIRTDESIEKNVVRAIMLIEVVGASTSHAIKTLKGFKELIKIHTTNGSWDLVGEVRASDLHSFDAVLRGIRELEFVHNTETSILLTSQ